MTPSASSRLRPVRFQDETDGPRGRSLLAGDSDFSQPVWAKSPASRLLQRAVVDFILRAIRNWSFPWVRRPSASAGVEQLRTANRHGGRDRSSRGFARLRRPRSARTYVGKNRTMPREARDANGHQKQPRETPQSREGARSPKGFNSALPPGSAVNKRAGPIRLVTPFRPCRRSKCPREFRGFFRARSWPFTVPRRCPYRLVHFSRDVDVRSVEKAG